MTSSIVGKPAWLITLIVAAVMVVIGAVLALVFGSFGTAIIIGVMVIPVLLLAGLLYIVERAAVRAVSLNRSRE